MITYNDIPSNLRVPFMYHEFDPSRANTGSIRQMIMVWGQRLSTGTVAEATPVIVTRPEQGEEFFGRGSQLSHTINYLFKTNPTVLVMAIALDDLPAGVAATGNIAFTGSASTSGTLEVSVADEMVRVGVAVNDTQDAIATAVAAAITAETDFPVTAQVDGGNTNQVNLTARHKGEYANDFTIDVRFSAVTQPTAPVVTPTQMSGGTGNPDITAAIAAMGDEWYNWLICPWTDAANMALLEAELVSRFGPTRQIGARAFIAYRGTYGGMQGFGDSRNCPHVTCMGTGLAPQPPYIWAAVNAGVASASLAIDPSRQLSSLVLPFIKPPAVDDRLTKIPERNLLLQDGISTYSVDAAGNVLIEAQITMYQENSQGVGDDSMLYINVPELFDRYRYEKRVLFAPHARDKLADDGNNLPTGQPIMTPKKAKGMLLNHYRRLIEDLAWCEDYESYAESLLVEKDGNRLRVVDQPNFIDNFRQLYMRSELVT